MRDYVRQSCEPLEARVKELEDGLDALLNSINPHDHPSRNYKEWDGKRVGSKTIPSDETIIAAKQLLNQK